MGKGNPFWVKVLARMPFLLKSANFVNDEIIARTGVKFSVAHSYLPMTGEYLKKILYFHTIFNLIKDIEGDIVECGVSTGESLAVLSVLVSSQERERAIWGFDSFEGLPEPSNEDLVSPKSVAEKGKYFQANISIVRKNIKTLGLSDAFIDRNVHCVKGWLEDTLPSYQGADIAFLNLDVDLYDSSMVTLKNLWPRVVSGGVVAFDEYHTPVIWPGEKKAVDEFFGEIPGTYTWCEDPFSKRCYVIKK